MARYFRQKLWIVFLSLIAIDVHSAPIVVQANQNLSFFATPGIPSYRNCPGGMACAVGWGKRNDKYLVLDQRMIGQDQYYCVVPIGKIDSRESVDRLGANCNNWILNSPNYFRTIPMKDCPKSFRSVFDKTTAIQELAAEALPEGDLSYEKCEGKKGSFEEEFAEHGFVKEIDFLPDIDPVCTLEAMRIRQKPDRYCAGNNIVKNTKRDPFVHCLGPNYHKALHNTLSIVSRCMGLQPQDLLGLLTAESGFNINTISPTGATGIGQVVDGWVSNFNDTYRPHFLKVVENSQDPECKKVWPHMVMTDTYPGRKCDAVKPPTAPVQSMFVGLAHFVLAEMKLADNLLDYASRVGMAPSDPASKIIFDEIRTLERRLVDLKQQSVSIPQRPGWREEQRAMREEINRIETFDLPHLQRKVVLQNEDLRRMMREAAIYSHNYGTGTGPMLLNLFLASRTDRITYSAFTGPNGAFAKFLTRQIPMLKVSQLGIAANSTKRRIRDRQSEMLNYIYTLAPGGAGSASGVSKSIRAISEAVSEVTGQAEGVEARCSSL